MAIRAKVRMSLVPYLSAVLNMAVIWAVFGGQGADIYGNASSANRSGPDFWENVYAGKIVPSEFSICSNVRQDWDQTKNRNVNRDPRPSSP